MSEFRLKLFAKQAKRLPMKLALATVCKWSQRATPETGLTVVIACMRRLLPLAMANLRLLQRSDAPAVREIVLVFDCQREQLGEANIAALQKLGDKFVVRLRFYSAYQVRVLRAIDWGWCYAWLSWSIAVGESRTRHVLLQDLDALVLDPGFLQRRYEGAVASGAAFYGMNHYYGSGITTAMGLCVTYELVIDVAAVRGRFAAIDAFNQVRLIEGRLVDFDTFLWIQHVIGSGVVSPEPEGTLMHPSQLICNHTDLLNGRPIITKRLHSLPLMPYYNFLGDENSPELREFGAALASGVSPELAGCPVPIGHITPSHWAWMYKQCVHCEQRLFGSPRPAVQEFLRGFAERAGDALPINDDAGSSTGVENGRRE